MNIKEKQKNELRELLRKADEHCSRNLLPDHVHPLEVKAEYLMEHGVEVRVRGEWIKDESYAGENKVVYRCSVCDHWQSAKKRTNKMFYMRYCPYCGAYMDKQNEKEGGKE